MQSCVKIHDCYCNFVNLHYLFLFFFYVLQKWKKKVDESYYVQKKIETIKSKYSYFNEIWFKIDS